MDQVGGGSGATLAIGEFWPSLAIVGHFLAIFGDFGTGNFSKCEKRAQYFSVRIFGTKKIFFWVAHNNDFASFFFFFLLVFYSLRETTLLCMRASFVPG